ncbi:hypothetical protein IQ247_16290 [Plectonema cf. radiosum LEGE 06105]|uniref:Uncharacterized protein n=1 Tax=Plectonema cf. radiosum LEGE 06105 TaxID=945769 RepID=A0A8J7K2H8_9CYAN|nr:hypothetical protein [Plectonema radiosum]MBE9214207.1 hypothetical protein [Plectonema cf. radiosum LEGE 06105]
MDSEYDYKRKLIKIYFELLKENRENASYPILENVKTNLEAELITLKKELESAKLFLAEIELFLVHPLPVPPYLSKKIIQIIFDDISRDLKAIVKKIVLFTNRIDNRLINTNISKQIVFSIILLMAFLFFITAFFIAVFIRKHFSLFILLILIFVILLYSWIKLKSLRIFYKEKISVLQELCNQKENEIEALESQIRESKIYDISDLEEKIDKWLEEDKTSLISLGMQKLKIEHLVDQQPILSFVGISSAEKLDSYILTTDRELEKINKNYREILINENDFYKEKGNDGKYRYGVYECFLIYLCENFLSYYRCYWNFLKGDYVDEETCEYLFDSIVSVKTRERSSLNQQNPEEKRKYADILSLTTMDGKIVYFKMSDDKKQRINSDGKSKYVSGINQAAARIRYWLRQRRVDYQKIKDLDS